MYLELCMHVAIAMLVGHTAMTELVKIQDLWHCAITSPLAPVRVASRVGASSQYMHNHVFLVSACAFDLYCCNGTCTSFLLCSTISQSLTSAGHSSTVIGDKDLQLIHIYIFASSPHDYYVCTQQMQTDHQ